MSYWEGYAANYSRRVESAYARVRGAEKDLLEVMASEYPVGAHVIVVHSGGKSYSGTVTGWDSYGARVVVKNDRTWKVSKRWAAQVGLVSIPSQDPQT